MLIPTNYCSSQTLAKLVLGDSDIEVLPGNGDETFAAHLPGLRPSPVDLAPLILTATEERTL